MRELLFRGKLVYNGVWVYGGIYKEPVDDIKNGLTYIITSSLSFAGNANIIIPETVGQFTGLLDKTGKKIFEGDIIQDGKDIVTVEWDEKFATWALLKRGWMYKHFFGEAIDSKDCEVIGNIQDNPELLS